MSGHEEEFEAFLKENHIEYERVGKKTEEIFFLPKKNLRVVMVSNKTLSDDKIKK